MSKHLKILGRTLLEWGEKRAENVPVSSIRNPNSEFVNALRHGWGSEPLDGVTVNERTAMGLAAFWRCVSLISQGISGLPFKVYQQTDKGKQTVDHQVNKLFNKMMNPQLISFTGRSFLLQQKLVHGNGIAIINRDGNAFPERLTPVHYHQVRKIEKINDLLYYTIRIESKERIFSQEDIFHIKGPTLDGIVGMSVIQAHAHTIGMDIAARKFGANQYERNFTASGVITTPNTLSDDARIRLRSEGARFRGPNGDEGFMVLDNDMKLDQFRTMPNTDAQYIESRQFGRDDIATIFGVPPYMVGSMDKATFNNVEQMNIQLVQYTFMPHMTEFEQESNAKLLRENQKETHYTKHTVNALLRGDHKTRFEAYQLAINNGWMEPDEVRELEEMDKRGGQASKLWMQLNVAPIDEPRKESNEQQ